MPMTFHPIGFLLILTPLFWITLKEYVYHQAESFIYIVAVESFVGVISNYVIKGSNAKLFIALPTYCRRMFHLRHDSQGACGVLCCHE